jgi:hypothetical protein
MKVYIAKRRRFLTHELGAVHRSIAAIMATSIVLACYAYQLRIVLLLLLPVARVCLAKFLLGGVVVWGVFAVMLFSVSLAGPPMLTVVGVEALASAWVFGAAVEKINSRLLGAPASLHANHHA